MEGPPIFSTFTLITEIFVTVAVLFIFYQGYKHNKFFPKLVFFVLAYETLVNITYMSYRALTHTADVGPHHHTAFHIGVAIFHGVMAIIMFVALVVFFIIAWRKYKKGINYFKEHKIFTIIFVILWMTAVFSGLLFYYLAYFTTT